MIIRSLKIVYQDLLTHKLRSFLSLLGIIIGVAVVFIIGTLSDITKQVITQQLTGNEGVITIQYLPPENENQTLTDQINSLLDVQASNPSHIFTKNDMDALRKIKGVIDVLGNYATISPVSISDSEDISALVIRYTENYTEFYNYPIMAGNNLYSFTDQQRLSIALVDDIFVTNETTYNTEDIIGKTIQLHNRLFVVVGVLENQSLNITGTIFLSDLTYDSIFSMGKIENISLKVDPSFNVDAVGKEALEILNYLHGTVKQYEVQNFSAMIAQITAITGMISIIMMAIALISLVVSGIGIMNIMLVSVIERTKEIAIKRAIGASKNTIRTQFLMEACSLTTIGGILGIFLGFLIIKLVLYLLDFSIPLTIHHILPSLFYSLLLGMIFGYFPARRAANLNIIKAISTE